MEKQAISSKDSTHDRSSITDADTINMKVEQNSRSNSEEAQVEPLEAPEEEWEYITGFKLFCVIGMVTLTCFLMLLDTSIVATAVPQITSDFHSLEDVGWYGSAFLLANCAITPTSGKLYSRFGSKITFISFVFLFELGSMICALARNSDMLIVGRAIAGMGGSGLVNGALTIIAASVPLQKRATYTGILMAFAQIGILLGPVIGGALTQYTTWRWCFWINLPPGGVVIAILMLIHIPDRTQAKKKKMTLLETLHSLDLPGFALFAPTSIMLLLALQWGGSTYAWNSATIIGLFCGSGGMLVPLLWWEYRQGDNAMIPWSMIKQRIVYSSCLMMFFFFASQMINAYYLAIYFQSVRGDSPTMSGVSILPGILSQMMFAPLSGVLVGRMGYYLPWVVGGTGLTSICYGLLSTLNPTTSIGKWIGYQVIGGIGRGCSMQMAILAIQNTVKPEQISTSMAIAAFSQTFGGALFLSFAQISFTDGLANGIAKYAPQVNILAVQKAGANGFHDAFPPALIPGIIQSYSVAINHAFYLAVGSGVACFVVTWGMGWKSIKKPKVVEAAA
ncbi:major facilitator superfamily domain-containing protein [Tricladium varicosporioides]|nr:major facilitator superfamily domain-containing protein [Hymenoscyphus varicosporioides]